MSKKMKQRLCSLFLEIFHYFLGYAVTILTLQCFLLGFEIPFYQKTLLIGAFLFHTVSFLWLSRKGKVMELLHQTGSLLLFLFTLLILAILFFLYRADIFAGFSEIGNEVNRCFVRYYGGVSHGDLTSGSTVQVSSAALCFCVLCNYVINYVLIKNGPRILFVIASLLPVVFPFLAGLTGTYQYLLCYIACAIPIMAVGIKRTPAVRKSLRFLVFIITSVSIFVITRFFPVDYYESIDADKLKKNIQKTFEGLENDIYQKLFHTQEDSAICAGGLNHGELGWVDEIHYSNKEALTITVPEEIRENQAYSLFFRSYIGEKYESNHFTTLDHEARLEKDTLNKKYNYDVGELSTKYISTFGLFGLENVANIKIKNIWAGQDYYIPYNCLDAVDEGRDGKLQFASSVPIEAYNAHSYYRCTDTIRELLATVPSEYGTFATDKIELVKASQSTAMGAASDKILHYEQMEADYRNYVRKYDLAIPKGLCDKTTELFYTKARELGADLNNLSTDEDFIFQYDSENSIINDRYLQDCTDSIMEYLTGHTRYSLTPGKVPDGKDLIDYFLFENQEGFCSYYAATATIAFRAMGIPARYVEGFKASRADIENALKTENRTLTFTLKDVNAHAWVEIYIDGFGWFPVEVTPGFIEGTSNQLVDGDISELNRTPQPSESPEPSMEPSPEPEESPAPEEPSETPAPDDGSDGANLGDDPAPLVPENSEPPADNPSEGNDGHPDSSPLPDDSKDQKGSAAGTGIILLCILLVAGALVTLGILYVTKDKRTIRHALSKRNRSERVKELYPLLEKTLLRKMQKDAKSKSSETITTLSELLKKTDCIFLINEQPTDLSETIERIITLGEKAAFSGTELSEEEWHEFRKLFQMLSQT